MPPLSIIRPAPSTPFPEGAPVLTRNAILGKWHVVRSSLGMWRSKCNVTITYGDVPGGDNPLGGSLDDLVEYSSPKNISKRSSVAGIDKPIATPGATYANPPSAEGEGKGSPAEGESQLQYQWRGKGWLKIASSKWQVIAYGGDNVMVSNSSTEGGRDVVEGDVEWMVIYFESTLFTSAGMDILTRRGKLSEEAIAAIQEQLKDCGKDVTEQLPKMFDVLIIDEGTD